MPAIRAQTILHTDDSLPANFVTNSWCFDGDDAVTQAALITPLLKAFYDDLATWWGASLSQGPHEVKYSALPGVQPNYPFLEDTFSLDAEPGATPLPTEVALALSFQADRIAGQPQNRRRGRLYLGPLNSTTMLGGRPTQGFIDDVAAAADTFAAAILAVGPPQLRWSIWSTVDQAAVPVSNGWLDNAFDTQRRRGVQPTARTTW